VTVGRHLGGAIEISLKVVDFRNGSKTEVTLLPRQVRSTLRSRRRQAIWACPKSANRRLAVATEPLAGSKIGGQVSAVGF
jgi:hypothetical protein